MSLLAEASSQQPSCHSLTPSWLTNGKTLFFYFFFPLSANTGVVWKLPQIVFMSAAIPHKLRKSVSQGAQNRCRKHNCAHSLGLSEVPLWNNLLLLSTKKYNWWHFQSQRDNENTILGRIMWSRGRISLFYALILRLSDFWEFLNLSTCLTASLWHSQSFLTPLSTEKPHPKTFYDTKISPAENKTELPFWDIITLSSGQVPASCMRFPESSIRMCLAAY